MFFAIKGKDLSDLIMYAIYSRDLVNFGEVGSDFLWALE